VGGLMVLGGVALVQRAPAAATAGRPEEKGVRS
jgi:hypothetical protein